MYPRPAGEDAALCCRHTWPAVWRCRSPIELSSVSSIRGGYRRCPSGDDCVGARRPSQNRRNVLEQLDATVERATTDHVESNVGIAIVDPLPAAGSGDDRKDHQRKRSTRPASRKERHKVRLPMVRIDLEPLAFMSATASTGSRATSRCSPKKGARSTWSKRQPSTCAPGHRCLARPLRQIPT